VKHKTYDYDYDPDTYEEIKTNERWEKNIYRSKLAFSLGWEFGAGSR